MNEVHRLLAAAGLGGRGLEEKASVEIGLDEAPSISSERTSRLGGLPPLPEAIPWPSHQWPVASIAGWPTWAQDELAAARTAGQVFEQDGKVWAPIPFLAQIDLAELTPFELEHRLPHEGFLLFFAAQTIDAGDRPALPFAKATCVLLVDGTAPLREPPPLSEPGPSGVVKWAPSPRLRLDLSFEEQQALLATVDERGRAAVEAAVRNESDALFPVDDGSLHEPPAGSVALLRIADRHPLISIGDASWLTFRLDRAALERRAFDDARAIVFAG